MNLIRGYVRNKLWFNGLVVMISVLHTEGLRFDPGLGPPNGLDFLFSKNIQSNLSKCKPSVDKQFCIYIDFAFKKNLFKLQTC